MIKIINRAVCLILIIFLNFKFTIARFEHKINNLYDKNIPQKNFDETDDRLMHPILPLSKEQLQQWFNHETETEYWTNEAMEALNKRLNNKLNKNIAKNIIFYLGDGMSIPTIFAARIYKGQLDGKFGEEDELYWESFPNVGLLKTWCIDEQVPDSACTSTAYMTGVKTKYGVIGINGNAVRGDCKTQNNRTNYVDSILKLAQDHNKSVGIVTTTRITHASPAGGYAHTVDRHWECDSDKPHDKSIENNCMDIATQLITQYPGREFKVLLGGGRSKFLPKNIKDEENKFGERLDNVNLIEMWIEDKKKRNSKYLYAWNRTTLINSMDKLENYDFLLGLFDASHLPYHLDANSELNPTLSEMTEAAIKVLKKNPNGFILFVEGGRIDHAHHGTYATLALDETVEFAKAVKIGREMTGDNDTLVIVASDHGHTMSVAGYSKRGTKINGISNKIAIDDLPYTTLSYANGQGYKQPDKFGGRYDISKDNLDDKKYEFSSAVPLAIETHGGEDVAIFSSGPWSHLFTGTIQQSNIRHFLAYASCLAPMSACNNNK